MENLNFKEWFQPNPVIFTDVEIANMYFHNTEIKVKEIAEKTQKSIGEVYRILKRYGSPNRQNCIHDTVKFYSEAGFPAKKIAEFTGYTPRNVRYILKKGKK